MLSMPGTFSVGIYVFIKAGGRYENSKKSGLSHLIEHLSFSGTKKWPTGKKLIDAIEGIGGLMNAWTGIESINYFIKIPKEKLEIGLEVMADMIFNLELDETKVRKEKKLINQEIKRKEDIPDLYIYNLLTKIIWPNHPLGRTIFGNEKNLDNFSLKMIKQYLTDLYVTENMVVSIAGDVSLSKIKFLIEKFFNQKTGPKKAKFLSVKEIQEEPRVIIDFKKTKQVHLAFGIRSLPNDHPDEFVLYVINSLLGVGFNSRLFLNIRSEKGLSYNIHSRNCFFQDTGLLGIFGGVKRENFELAVSEIVKELKRFKIERIPAEELRKTKEKFKNRFLFGIELPEDRAKWLGYQEFSRKKFLSPEEFLKKIEAVTKEDIIRVARKLFISKRVNLALIGPIAQTKKVQLQEILKKID